EVDDDRREDAERHAGRGELVGRHARPREPRHRPRGEGAPTGGVALLDGRHYAVDSRKRATRLRCRIRSGTIPTAPPATASIQNLFAVAMTLNQTTAGQSAQATFATLCRQTYASVTPTISASAAWRLGIAA